MADIPGLTDYLGPLPTWAWIGVGAGALFLWHRHTSAGTGTGLTGSIIGSGQATPDTTEEQANQLTNDVWGQSALNALIGAGVDPLQADYAIRGYLNDETLDPSAQSLISQALKAAGPTPEPIQGRPEGGYTAPTLPTPSQPAATPKTSAGVPSKTGTANPNYKTINYTVKKGDTFEGIAKHYHTTVEKLRKDNNMLHGHLAGKVGTTLKIRVHK